MSRKRKQRRSGILEKSIHAITKKIKINHLYDVPYIAGYSKNGKIVYIDRRLPLFMRLKNRKHKRINITKFLVLHEVVEKAIIQEVGHIHYEYAHEIASIAEKKAILLEKISLKHYDQFIQKYAKLIEKEKITKPPPDLDLKPYRDEKDFKQLKELLKNRTKRGRK